MKKIAFLFAFLCAFYFKSQTTEFSITDEGLTKFVITPIPGINKVDAYKKTINWINKRFNTPEKVIKGTIESEYIRIEGVSENAMRYPGIGGAITEPIKFQLEISFKDDRYKFEIIELLEKNYMFPNFSNSPYINLDFSKENKDVRKSNGEFRNRYKYASDVPTYFNYLNSKLKEYITSENNADDNW